MIKLKAQAAEAILAAAKNAFPTAELPSVEEIITLLEYPPDSAMGDLAFPCFRLSRVLRNAPPKIAAALAEGIVAPQFAKVEAVGGYLNFFADAKLLHARLLADIAAAGDMYGSPACGEGRTVVLDYSSPNVAKPFHIGHLGTTVIGHSLKLLHEFAGYNCVGINHLGDWGTQFGKLITAYRMWGNRDAIEEGGIDKLEIGRAHVGTPVT